MPPDAPVPTSLPMRIYNVGQASRMDARSLITITIRYVGLGMILLEG